MWVILFKKYTENECVPDCEKNFKYKRPIIYHFVESVGKFSDPD